MLNCIICDDNIGSAELLNADDLGYKSNNTDIAVISPGGLVTAIGEGTAVLTIYTENYDTTQILLTVTPAGTLIGDCDLDGAFSSADIAMLQNYLLGSESISDWQAADLCDDDVLDIFDLMRMRELLAK